MDVDPLEDTVPPRYAVESDEEDEYNPLEQASQPPATEPIEVKIMGKIPKSKPLVVASGDAATYWARGAGLGEQIGGVYVNKICVGLLFAPEWSQSTILVSEVTTRLPITFMDTYVKAVIAEFVPTSTSLLDVYPVPTYISAEPIPYYAAPIRYLSTGKVNDEISSHAEKFAPPNLITSTSASFLTNLAAQKQTSTLLLLPLAHIPPPLPKKLERSHLPTDHGNEWPDKIHPVHKWLFLLNNQTIDHPWVDEKKSKFNSSTGASRRGDIGEGGMYI